MQCLYLHIMFLIVFHYKYSVFVRSVKKKRTLHMFGKYLANVLVIFPRGCLHSMTTKMETIYESM